MSTQHLKITQAGLIALVTTAIGQIVAFIPHLAPYSQILISATSAVVAAGFLLANAVHALAASNVSARDVEAGAIAAAKTELGKVNFNQLVGDAVSAQSIPDLEARMDAAAKKALQSVLGTLAGGVPVVAPPVEAVPAPPA